MCKVVDDMSHSQETEMNASLGPWPMEWCCSHLGLPQLKPSWRKCSHRHPQRLVSYVILNIMKLTVHISPHSDPSHITQSVCLTSVGYMMSELDPVILKKFCVSVSKG